MAATTAGALKALIEGAGLGLAVFRDEAPTGQALPYVTVSDGLSTIREPAFNPLNDAVHVSELAQVDLWQQWRARDTRTPSESATLAAGLFAALNGARLPMAPTLVFGCTVEDERRLLERDDNKVRNVFTVKLRRRL